MLGVIRHKVLSVSLSVSVSVSVPLSVSDSYSNCISYDLFNLQSIRPAFSAIRHFSSAAKEVCIIVLISYLLIS